MKKTIIALALLGGWTTMASAQSNVTVYGILDAGVTRISNDGAGGSPISIQAGQLATSRWGFRGSEDLGNGLKANFVLEGTLANDTGAFGSNFGTPATTTSLFDRQATIGLSGKFGSVDLGRQNSLNIGMAAVADPMGLSFAGTNPHVLFTSMNHAGVYGAYGSNGGGTALRQNNSIKYATPSFGGLGFSLMRSLGERADSSQGTYNGVSAFFGAKAVTAAGYYSRMTNTTNNDELTNFGAGVKVTAGLATIKASYSSSEFDTANRKITVAGLGVDYPVQPNVVLTAAYYNTRHTGDADTASDQLNLIGKYALSKRSTLYASIGRATTDDVITATTLVNLAQGFVTVGSDSATRITAGVTHAF